MSLYQALILAGERLPWPDSLSRLVIASLVERMQVKLDSDDEESEAAFAKEMARFPIAVNVEDANRQHYELPPEFFSYVLGPQRKYSCCYFADEQTSLSDAEDEALERAASHALIADGQRILELGCGWGSLSLWMARRFPKAAVTSVCNSRAQRDYILAQAAREGLDNLNVVTADMNSYRPAQCFDRIVSIEMFEHMSNWRPLLSRMHQALAPEGHLYLHVFAHRQASYRFDRDDPEDWIAQHFFTGGIMPGASLIKAFDDLFYLESEWRWSGTHYTRTARAWLSNFDRNSSEIWPIVQRVYGQDASLWLRRWRLFFLATAGMFGHDGGRIWGVHHYRLSPR